MFLKRYKLPSYNVRFDSFLFCCSREREREREEGEGERRGRERNEGFRSLRLLPILLLFPPIHCLDATPCLIDAPLRSSFFIFGCSPAKRCHPRDAATNSARMLNTASHDICGSLGPRSNLLKRSQACPDCSDDEASPCANREEGLECPTNSARMLNTASLDISGSLGPRSNLLKRSQACPDCSDDEASPCANREEGLECPICCESFNTVENVPYVLWCGHTLCKNCVLGLQRAVVKFPSLPIQLPLFISCPWCHVLSFRLIYRGQLRFPRKNFFLLWMVESMNSDRAKWCSACILDCQSVPSSNSHLSRRSSDHQDQQNIQRIPQYTHSDNARFGISQMDLIVNYVDVGSTEFFLRKALVFLVHLTAKFPLVVIFLFIVLYVIPTSAAILALYILVTILFALPSFLVLYFAYPGLDWLVREITS